MRVILPTEYLVPCQSCLHIKCFILCQAVSEKVLKNTDGIDLFISGELNLKTRLIHQILIFIRIHVTDYCIYRYYVIQAKETPQDGFLPGARESRRLKLSFFFIREPAKYYTLCLFLVPVHFFFKINIFKQYLRNTIKVPQCLQRLSAL